MSNVEQMAVQNNPNPYKACSCQEQIYPPDGKEVDCKNFFRHMVRSCRNGPRNADLVSKDQVCRNVFCTKHLLRLQRFLRQGQLAHT